ncbi:MAG: efflux RND transporter periplasmic adaptor subunit [Pseudomonadota bacterium]
MVPFTPETHTPVLNIFGQVDSTKVLDIRPATGGMVMALHENFANGGTVAQGDLLIQIDPANAETALALTQADRAEAAAELRDATRALDLAREELIAAEDQAALRLRALARQQDLVARGVGTEAAVETAELNASSARQTVLARKQSIAQAESRMDLAKARVERLNITLAQAERTLTDTKLYAPFDGVLSDVNLVPGGIVTANERVGQLLDPQALEVEFRVSAAQHARLQTETGQLRDAPVTVTLDVFGAEITHPARLVREAPMVGDGQTGRLLFAGLKAATGLRPGDFVQVQVEEPPLQWVARLPASAIGANNTVLVVGDEDRLREERVTLIRRQGDDVLVRSRDLAGMNIVAERSPLLGAGIKVRMLQLGTATVPQAPEMVELTDDRRARLIAFVEGNNRMPKAAKDRVLARLAQDKVPAEMVVRLESRMGG